nr:TIGR02452 family protein [Lachnospiraceae bacterium]
RTKPNRYAPLENGGSEMDREELLACHIRRTAHLLTAAAARGADTLVLGAFGCGAFQNDAGVVAEAFRTALEGFPGRFRKVEFAVHCSPRSDGNYRAFAEAFR